MKKLINLGKEGIPLELATHDVGKGFMHVTLPGKGELVVEDDQITLVIEKLAKKNRHRKPAITIEDVEVTYDEEVANAFVCDVCQRWFGTERGLQTHMRVHKEDELVEETIEDTEEDD